MQEFPTSGQIPKMNRRRFWRSAFWFLIAVIVAVLIYMSVKPDQGVPVDSTNGDSSTNEPVSTTNYEYRYAWQEEDQTRALEDVQSLAPGQVFTTGVVQDPTDEQVIYFATSAHDTRNQSNLVSVYRYRTDDFSFERLFRTTYEQGNPIGLDERILPTIHVIGYEDGHLILLATDVNDKAMTEDKCDVPYLIGMDEDRLLVTLDIRDPYAGFEDYTPGDDVLNWAQETEDLCLAGKKE